MDFKLMDEANYNFVAQKEGWIYEWTDKFEIKNNSIMTPELLNQILIDLPSLDVFENPIPGAQIAKSNLETRINNTIKTQDLGGMSK